MTRTSLFVLVLFLAGCSDTANQSSAIAQEQTKSTSTQASPKPELNRTVIGAWSDERPYASSRITFEKANDELRVHRKFFDSSQSDELLEIIPGSNSKKFKEPNDSNPDEYYVVNGQGDLEIWDKQGLVTTAKKVD